MTNDNDSVVTGRRFLAMMAEGTKTKDIRESEDLTHTAFWRIVNKARDADRPVMAPRPPPERRWVSVPRAEWTYLTEREISQLRVYRDEIRAADRIELARERADRFGA